MKNPRLFNPFTFLVARGSAKLSLTIHLSVDDFACDQYAIPDELLVVRLDYLCPFLSCW